MAAESLIGRMVQTGTVTAIDTGGRKARVKFPATGITSAWLYVLDTHPHIPDYDGAEQKTELKSGGTGEASFEAHYHNLTIKPWMPNVGDKVVCLYLPVDNSDGFVLGAIV